jgi:hypothetical protein
MIRILQSLEAVCFKPDHIILNELDSVNSIVFITDGKIDIGFEINKKIMFKMRLTNKIVIGFYECSLDRRSLLIYKSHNCSTGYFIRKKNWFFIQKDYPLFAD